MVRGKVRKGGRLWFVCLLVAAALLPAALVGGDAGAAEGDTGTSEKIREPILAGAWYPAEADELRRMVTGFLENVPETALPGRPVAILAPHAGYAYSGQVAAHAYRLLEREKYETVVVLAPSHHAPFKGVSVYDQGGYRTPLGIVPLDRELVSALRERDAAIRFVPEAHAREHSLEIQLPFLQVAMPGFKLVPLVMWDHDFETCRRLADALSETIRGKSVLVVASSDLSHFHSQEKAARLDRLVLDKVEVRDARGLSELLSSGKCEACGGGPLVTAMLIAERLGATGSRVLRYATSGDATGDRERVVGYMAAALWTDPKPTSRAGSGDAKDRPKGGADSGRIAEQAKKNPPEGDNPESTPALGAEDRTYLLSLAKQVVEARCRGEKRPGYNPPSQALKEPCGAFVTLKKHGELRGCIGYVVGVRPLVETVAEVAESAAFRDPRFPPVEPDELKDLKYEISVLTPLRRITTMEAIQVGKHGIVVKRDGHSGLLLPQVATEYGWDRTTFLEYTCRKAGLPKDAWRDGDTEIYIFSAEVFGEQ